MKKRIFIPILLLLCCTQLISAQENSRKYVDFTANIQTNHLWRGLIICDKPMASVLTTFYLDQSGSLTAGFWGGMGISNETDGTHYKEINYYIQYAKGGFSIGLWDLFNTRGATAPNVWNYKQKESGHILDLRTAYHFGETFPMRLEADVLLFGSADIEFHGTDVKQRFSTYLQVSYDAISGDVVNLTPFIGAGFALNGKNHLYGIARDDDKKAFDLVNMGITVSKTIKVNNWNVPVHATTLWNPAHKFARVQIGITLF